MKFRFNYVAAARAIFRPCLGLGSEVFSSRLRGEVSTPPAFENRKSFFNTENWNKKNREIMVQSA
jgi:hypothetical protein